MDLEEYNQLTIKLNEIDKKVLVKEFMQLSIRNEAVENCIKRLVAAPEENLKIFKTKLAAMKRRSSYISYSQINEFMQELSSMLANIESGAKSPKEALKAIKSFIEADKYLFNIVDDSYGDLGGFYSNDLIRSFSKYAQACEDKDFVTDLVLDLILQNDYGARDSLAEYLPEYLPEKNINTLITKLWQAANNEEAKHGYKYTHLLLKTIAKATNNPNLFEEVSKLSSDKNELHPAAIMELAQIHFNLGNYLMSLNYLENPILNDGYTLHERDKLLAKVYLQLNMHKNLEDLLWKKYTKSGEASDLANLLEVIGNDKQEEIVKTRITDIFKKTKLAEVDMRFLYDLNCFHELAELILKFPDDVNGGYYSTLLNYAKKLEADNYFLATIVIYRALLDSILERAYTKSYQYGVNYLKKLDKLETKITDWQSIIPHSKYKANIQAKHKLKSSFWSKYK